MINFVSQTKFIDSTADILVHQVNCCGAMGKGIAKEIKEKFPEVYLGYKEICSKIDEPKDLLGECFILKLKDREQYVANLFAQLEWTGLPRKYPADKMLFTPLYGRQVNYEALYRSLEELNRNAMMIYNQLNKRTISISFREKMGCCNAGGSWDIVLGMISHFWENNDKIEVIIHGQ